MGLVADLSTANMPLEGKN